MPPKSFALVFLPRPPGRRTRVCWVPSHSRAADLFTGWDRTAREMMGVLRSQAAPDEHDP